MDPLNYALVKKRLSGRSRQKRRCALIQLDAVIDPRPRNLAIYRAAVGEYPELAPVLVAAENGDLGDAGIGTLQQEASMYPADRAALYAFWYARYHEESWLHYDLPYPGASELLWELSRDGFDLIYLCNRDGPNMGMGTRAVVRRHRLPCDPPVEFLFRPTMGTPEDEFIEHALRPFHGGERRIELVLENRAGRANRIHEIIPNAMVVLVGNEVASASRKLYPSIVTCDRYAESLAQ